MWRWLGSSCDRWGRTGERASSYDSLSGLSHTLIVFSQIQVVCFVVSKWIKLLRTSGPFSTLGHCFPASGRPDAVHRVHLLTRSLPINDGLQRCFDDIILLDLDIAFSDRLLASFISQHGARSLFVADTRVRQMYRSREVKWL